MTDTSIKNNDDNGEIAVTGAKNASKQQQQQQQLLLLSERMRAATKDVHEQSDKKVTMKLAIVLTSKELFAEAISLFWPIYRELEIQLETHKDHQQLKLLYPLLEILRRTSRLEADIEYLVGNDKIKAQQLMNRRMCSEHTKKSNTGDDGMDEMMFHPAELQEYINTLRHYSNTNPILLIPYIFAMYGAIMAGGSMIKRMVKTAFRLPSTSDQGVTMFVVEFDENTTEFSSTNAVRKEMKRILNEDMEFTTEEEACILKEAPRVFIRNNALIETVKDTPIFGIILHRFWFCCIIFGIIAFIMAITAVVSCSKSVAMNE